MPYTLRITPDQSFVDVRHHGDVAADEFERITSDLQDSLEPGSAPNVLIDVRAATSYPSKSDFLLWLKERERPLPPASRIAILTSDQYANVVEFITLAVQSKGLNMQDFASEHVAMRWLTDDEAAESRPG